MDPNHYVGYTINSGRSTLNLLWSCLVTVALCTWTIQRLQIIPWSALKTILFRKKLFWMVVTLFWDKVDDGLCFTIRLDNLVLLMKEGILQLPNIQLSDLKERNKNDKFGTFVTGLQVLYFVVHSAGRLRSSLPLSILEVSTLAFVWCAIFIEYFWWNKPLDLRSTTVTTLESAQRVNFLTILPRLHFDLPEQDAAETSSFELFFDRVLRSGEWRSTIHVAWIGCMFNGIHIFASYCSFPSRPERLLWQITSVGACFAIIITWSATFVRPVLAGLLAGACTVFYCACRSYLIVEGFLGLRSVPEALYQSAAWENILPGV